MTINKIKNGSELTIALEGRLDTTTAPQAAICAPNRFAVCKPYELAFLVPTMPMTGTVSHWGSVPFTYSTKGGS